MSAMTVWSLRISCLDTSRLLLAQPDQNVHIYLSRLDREPCASSVQGKRRSHATGAAVLGRAWGRGGHVDRNRRRDRRRAWLEYLAGMLGAFGRRSANRYKRRFPMWSSREGEDGASLFKMPVAV